MPLASPTPSLASDLASGTRLTVELFDKTDAAGALLEEVRVVSNDGMAILYLAKGTKLLAVDGKPIRHVTITARQLRLRSFPPDRFLCGLAYEYSPEEVRLEPPSRLAISYDPSRVIPEADQKRPQIAWIKEAESTWAWLDGKADLRNHRVDVQIDRFGTYIVGFELLDLPPMPVS